VTNVVLIVIVIALRMLVVDTVLNSHGFPFFLFVRDLSKHQSRTDEVVLIFERRSE
jgi:hypothetical protein